MLALDRTLGCIEASEPDVLDMYCSAPIMTAPVPDAGPESCEAYVCAIRKKSSVHIYVALVADNKRIFVYTPSGGPDREGHYLHTLQEALSFSQNMGFAPERINLNYSSAMREVVVRNIKILRPPGSRAHAQLGNNLADTPTASGTKRSGTTKKNSSPVTPAAAAPVAPAVALTVTSVTASAIRPPVPLPAMPKEELATVEPTILKVATAPVRPSSVPELAELKGALSRMTEDNSVLRQQASEELDALRNNLAQALSDREKDREQLASVKAELLESQKVREKTEVAAVSVLKGNLAALSETRDALAAQVQELSAQQLSSAAELAAVRADRSRLSAENGALALRLESIEASSPDLALLQREVAAIKGSLDEANRLNQQLSAENTRQTAAFSLIKEEIARLRAERDAAQQRSEQFAGDNEKAASERDALRGEIAMLSTQRAAALHHLQRLQQEAAAGATEREELRDEITALATEREAFLISVARLQQESCTRAAEVQVLRSELATFAAERKEALLKVGRLQRESSTREAEVQLLRGELARLSSEREQALLRVGRLEQEIMQAQPSELNEMKPKTAAGESAGSANMLQPVAGKVQLSEPVAGKAQQSDGKVQHSEGKLPQSEGKVQQAEDKMHPVKSKLQFSEIRLHPEHAASWPTLEEVTATGKPDEVVPGGVAPGWPEAAQPISAREKDPETNWYATGGGKLGPLPNFSAGDDNFFPATEESEGCPGQFSLQPNLTAIEFGSPAEVVELQQSINQAYLSPEGKEQASCQGYICGLKTADGALRVVAAISIVQSGRTLVYLPELQPKDQGDYASAVTGAVNFLEGVGFLMEALRLGSGVRRDAALLGCKVLRQADRK